MTNRLTLLASLLLSIVGLHAKRQSFRYEARVEHMIVPLKSYTRSSKEVNNRKNYHEHYSYLESNFAANAEVNINILGKGAGGGSASTSSAMKSIRSANSKVEHFSQSESYMSMHDFDDCFIVKRKVTLTSCIDSHCMTSSSTVIADTEVKNARKGEEYWIKRDITYANSFLRPEGAAEAETAAVINYSVDYEIKDYPVACVQLRMIVGEYQTLYYNLQAVIISKSDCESRIETGQYHLVFDDVDFIKNKCNYSKVTHYGKTYSGYYSIATTRWDNKSLRSCCTGGRGCSDIGSYI